MGRALIVHQWVGQAGWGTELQAHPSEVLPASVTTNGFDVPQCIKQGGTPGVLVQGPSPVEVRRLSVLDSP